METLQAFMMEYLMPYPIRALFLMILLFCIISIRFDMNILKGGK